MFACLGTVDVIAVGVVLETWSFVVVTVRDSQASYSLGGQPIQG